MADEIPSQAQHVISKFGGVNAAARSFGHRNPSTVSGWLKRGLIPQRRWGEILEVAKHHGVPLSLEDFVRVGESNVSPAADPSELQPVSPRGVAAAPQKERAA